MRFARRDLRAHAVAATLVVALCCPNIQAQPPTPNSPEVNVHEAPITFSSRVNLISVPAVVRDAMGRAVGNLKKEDFQVFDKGKPQTITKFSIEESSTRVGTGTATSQENTRSPNAPEASLPEKYVAYLVDDVHLDRGDLLNARQAMHRHLDESLDSTSRAAIFTTSGVTLIDFSADRVKLHEAVNRLQPYTSGIDRVQGCPYISYYTADILVNQKLYLDGRLFSDQQLYQVIMSGADPMLTAKYGEALNCSGPCNQQAIDQLTKLPLCVVQALIKLREAARLAITYGDHETISALGALRDVVRKLSVMPGNRNLVLVSPGFLLTRDHRAPESDVFERAIRANIVINTIDIRGLFTIIPGGSADPGGPDPDSATQQEDVLAELAGATGGTFFHNDNDLKSGLNVIAARPEYVYVLGFSPQELKYDGSYHGLKVSLKNRTNLTIQARRGYWAPAHAVDSAEAAREEIQETVFSHDEVRAIPLDVQTAFFESGDAKYDLTVTARVDAKALRFDRTGDRINDTLTVVAGIFDPNGNYIAGVEKVLDMHLRERTLETFENAGINVKEDFTLAPGRYLVRVVVRDSGGNNITAKNAGIEIP